jgi:threonine synthase
MSIWRWADHWDAVPKSAQLSLGEGDTPLIRSRSIGPEAGLPNLFFKLETVNPSGSYKDRFAAAAISHMQAAGQKTCIATSSGNTGAALAAYCSAAGIRCRIAVVETAPPAKLAQMMAYGAEIFRVRGFGTDPTITEQSFAKLEELARQPGHALQISAYKYSPKGMAGVESIGFELAGLADHVFCPAGGGGLTLGVARGFAKACANGAVHCVQPAGNDTIATPLRTGAEGATEVDSTSQISGLQVASVIDGDEVIRECRPTGGIGHAVSDDSIWSWQKRLFREEGVFCEPAGAVALAGAMQAVGNGEIDRAARIVCLVTGSGFKDSASVERINSDVECPVIDADSIA